MSESELEELERIVNIRTQTACRARPFEKYRAVVEAAKACVSYETGRHKLRQALEALEEDV